MSAPYHDAESHRPHQDLSSVDAADADRLAQLGYTQDLKRGYGVLESFGSSFSIISVCTGITTLFSYGLATGGPGVMVNGWIFVSFFTMFVALSMAEITSAVPASGGPYHWAALLATPQQSSFAAWVTGIANLTGQFAVTTGITYGCAGLILALAAMDGVEPTAAKQIGIHAGLLISHGIVNSFGIKTLAIFNRISITLHSVGVASLAIALLASAPRLRSGREVFATFIDNTGIDAPGWSERASPAYVAVCGILLAQFTITGFDASAHMSEETHNAARAAPIGVITSVGASTLFGFFLLCSYLFSIQDLDAVIDNSYGQPVLEIFVQCFGVRGAKAAMAFIVICVWHCGLFSITSNSRMYYAFARDGGLPKFFAKVEPRLWSSPVRAIWLAVFLSFILALPALGSTVAYAAATSIATIGLYISYTLPVVYLLLNHKRFEAIKGPFNLGKFSRPCGLVAICYTSFLTIVFCLPTANPVNKETLNYTPAAVGIVAVYTLVSWFVYARKHFKGPRQEALNELSQSGGAPISHRLSDEKEGKEAAGHSVQRVMTDSN